MCARVIDGGLQRNVEVTLATQDGSAVGKLWRKGSVCGCKKVIMVCHFSLSHAASSDYHQLTVVLTFGESSERSCVQIMLVNDTALERPEYFMAMLSTVEGVVTLVPDTAQILIRDDDGMLILFYCMSLSVCNDFSDFALQLLQLDLR